MAKTARWTWLIYMAGDNNLEGAGRDDLAEMKRVGSNDDVNVIVQFDTERSQTTRYRVRKGRLDSIKKMPGVDCGDPKVLTNFLQWGTRQYPAEHYLVDVWNHGGGWENLPSDYDYDSIRFTRPAYAAKVKRLRRALFRTTVKKIHARPREARAVAIDCGSHDYLDNQELRAALANAMPDGRKFDLFACDACLMNMLEIAYEMKGTAEVMVGSEETEPAAGWPYAAILQQLVACPTMSSTELARVIVDQYGKYFSKAHETATQSALDLGGVDRLGAAVSKLADALLADMPSLAGAITLARDKAQKFEMPEYIDLGDFAAQLLARLPQASAARPAASAILPLLDPSSPTSVVTRNVTCGAKVAKAKGVSIYFPQQQDYCPDYADLAFSKERHWKEMLEALFRA